MKRRDVIDIMSVVVYAMCLLGALYNAVVKNPYNLALNLFWHGQ